MLNNINDLLLVAGQQEGGYEPYNEITQWVATDSTQYIDTGFIADQNTKIEIGLNILDTGTAVKAVFGSRNWNGSTVSKAFYFYKINGTTVQVGWGNQSKNIALDSATELQAPMRLIIDKGSVTLVTSAKTYTETLTSETFETATSLIIGTSRTGTSGTELDNRPASVDVRYCKLWNNGTPAYNYYPSLDSKIQPCLYDKVTKTFAYAKKISDGTTTYDLGFKRWNKFDVDYISFTGTQRIPTGIKPQVDIKTDITFRSDYTGSTASCLIGARYAASGSNRKAYAVWQCVGGSNTNPQSGYMRADLGNSSTGTDSIGKSYLCANWTNFVKDSEDNYLNNEPKTANTSYDFTSEKTSVDINIGCMANGSVGTDEEPLTPTYSNNFIGDIGRCIMYVEDVLTRDYKPVVWHNGDTTAVACLYDEVYNKMYTNAGTGSFKAYITNISTTKTNVFTTTGATSGKAINAEGQIINSSASSYSALLPIVGGTVIECVSGDTGNNNYRFHCYDSSGTWIEQSLVLYPEGAGTVSPITGSFTAPVNAKYVRVSYATQASNTIQVKSETETIYEVGKSVSGTPSASVSGVSNCFDTGLYGTQDTTVKHIAIAYDNDSTSGQLFGSYDGTQTTSKNLTINSTGTSGNTAPIRFDGKVISTPLRIGINKTVSIINSKYGLWVNDSLQGSWGSVNDFTTVTTMLILKCNNSTNVRNNGCGYCLILEKDVPVAEYIPVKNGNIIGLYDKVSKTLNTGVGTINFNVLD